MLRLLDRCWALFLRARRAPLVHTRHARTWCLEFARAHSRQKTRSVAAVESECANLLAALDWCAISPRSLDTGFRLAHRAGSFFKVTGNHAGWWSRYRALLRVDTVGIDSQVVVKMREAAAHVAYYSGEYLAAAELRAQRAESADDEAQSEGSDLADVEPSEALNGAQVTSLIAVIGEVSAGTLPRETAMQIISIAFNMPIDVADSLLGEVGRGFVPAEPAAPDDG